MHNTDRALTALTKTSYLMFAGSPESGLGFFISDQETDPGSLGDFSRSHTYADSHPDPQGSEATDASKRGSSPGP